MMTRRAWALLCFTLMSAPSMPVAAGQARSPIAGIWKGEFVRDGAASPNRVTLTLKAEAGGKVSGTVAGLPNPAEVKDGTYDAKTGALKLSLGKVDEPAVLLVLDGKVVKDTASGTITGEAPGTFSVTRQE